MDASQIVQLSDGDDLATLQNIFQDANAPQDGSGLEAPVTQLMADLKLQRTRILQGDIYCDIDANGKFGSDYYPTTGVGAAVAGDCYPLLWEIQWALSNNLSPHVAVAAYMPLSFVPFGAADTWDADTLARYKRYAEQLVRYIVKTSFDGGASSVVFEVSNEMDVADYQPLNWQAASPPQTPAFALLPLGPWGRFLWWIDPATYDLSQWPPTDAGSYPYVNTGLAYPYALDLRRLDHGILPVQKIFAHSVERVRRDPAIQAAYPGKTIEIAGPALSGDSFQWYPVPNYPGIGPKPVQPTMEELFLDFTLNPTFDIDPSTNLPRFNSTLDRFSFHFYGDFLNGYNPDPLIAPTTTLQYITSTIKAKLAALGHPEINLFVSEWGPASVSNNANPDINYSNKGAAWAAAFLTEAVADKIAMGSYLVVHDASGPDSGAINEASLMHKIVRSSDGSAAYYAKPAANVFQMFAMMTGTRKAVNLAATGTNLNAFAASDDSSAGIVVFNYDKSMFTQPAVDTPENFTVELDNLPFSGNVMVERYLVDAHTSNLAAYVDMRPAGELVGQTTAQLDVDPALLTDPQQVALQQVEQFCATVQVPPNGQNGQITLPSRSLGLGVTFWRVTQSTCTPPA